MKRSFETGLAASGTRRGRVLPLRGGSEQVLVGKVGTWFLAFLSSMWQPGLASQTTCSQEILAQRRSWKASMGKGSCSLRAKLKQVKDMPFKEKLLPGKTAKAKQRDLILAGLRAMRAPVAACFLGWRVELPCSNFHVAVAICSLIKRRLAELVPCLHCCWSSLDATER